VKDQENSSLRDEMGGMKSKLSLAEEEKSKAIIARTSLQTLCDTLKKHQNDLRDAMGDLRGGIEEVNLSQRNQSGRIGELRIQLASKTSLLTSATSQKHEVVQDLQTKRMEIIQARETVEKLQREGLESTRELEEMMSVKTQCEHDMKLKEVKNNFLQI